MKTISFLALLIKYDFILICKISSLSTTEMPCFPTKCSVIPYSPFPQVDNSFKILL